jgi:hypothetical protein
MAHAYGAHLCIAEDSLQTLLGTFPINIIFTPMQHVKAEDVNLR